MDLLEALQGFLRRLSPDRGDRVVVAFSGGGDSTALLWGLTRLAPAWELHLVAAHLDHGMDDAAAERAAQAAVLARRLGVPLVAARRAIGMRRRPEESPEAAARRVRYQFLEEVRRGCRARWVATAHHRDDQAETVLLRLRFGSGLRGLAAIQEVAGAVVRPLLALPRATLRQARARIRHLVLPALAPAAERAQLAAGLANLAARAQRALPALDRRLAAEIGLRAEAGEHGTVPAADRRRLAALPPPLLPFALALLHSRAGAAFPASLGAATELRRQLRLRDAPAATACRKARSTPLVACDCGAGWRWQAAGELVCLARSRPGETFPPFTYTLEVPGELAIPELAVTIRVSRRPVAAWMLRGAPLRAGLALPLPAAGRPGRVTVRNRRPGDRLWPLGAPGRRKLKDVLIDRGVPRRQRDRLPLLCWAGEIAWVPGITIDHRFRLTGEASAWLVEIRESGESGAAIGTARGDGAEPARHARAVPPAATGNPGREPAVSDSEGTSLPPPRCGVTHHGGQVGPAPLEVAEL